MNRPGNSSTGYIWLRDALIPGENALLDTLWVYPWISLALASTRSTAHIRFPFLWIIGLIAVPALAGRWLERSFSGRLILRRLALLLLAAGVLLLFVRTQTLPDGPITSTRWLGEALWPWSAAGTGHRQDVIVFGWLVACALLLRGVWLAEAEVTGDTARRWFLGGLAAFLLLFAILAHASPAAYSSDQRLLGPLLVLYFCLGVGWVALVQRQSVEEQTFRRNSYRVNRTWLVLVTAIGAAMVLLSTLVTVVGLFALHPVEQLALFLLGGIGQIIISIWDVAVFLLHGILSLLGLLPHGTAHPGPGRTGVSPPPPSPSSPALPWLAPALAVLIVIIGVPSVIFGIVLAVYLVARLILTGNQAATGSAGEVNSVSVWSWSLFLAQLGGLVRRLAGRWHFRRPRAPAAEPPGADPRPVLPASSVRGLYRSVLRLCREQGSPRRSDETPGEFESTLAHIVPPDLARKLTAAYVKVRYGRMSLPPAEIEGLIDGYEEYLWDS